MIHIYLFIKSRFLFLYILYFCVKSELGEIRGHKVESVMSHKFDLYFHFVDVSFPVFFLYK